MSTTSTRQIPSVSNSDIDWMGFKNDFYDQHCPVVIRHAASNCRALSTWTWESLADRFACVTDSTTANAIRGRTRTKSYRTAEEFAEYPDEQITIADFFRAFVEGDSRRFDYYLPLVDQSALAGLQTHYRQIDADLFGDLAMPQFAKTVHRGPNAWIGPEGHYEFNHTDSDDNFLMMIRGQKSARLFSPRFNGNMYWEQLDSQGYSIQSPVDLEDPDHEKFPRFAEAECIETILQPGDVLYIPVFWWHQISGLTDSISVNVFCSCDDAPNRYWDRISSPPCFESLRNHLHVNRRLPKALPACSKDDLIEASLCVLDRYPSYSFERKDVDMASLEELL